MYGTCDAGYGVGVNAVTDYRHVRARLLGGVRRKCPDPSEVWQGSRAQDDGRYTGVHNSALPERTEKLQKKIDENGKNIDNSNNNYAESKR